MTEDIETRKLELEQYRIEEELKLKRMEVVLQREQFEVNQRSKTFKEQVLSPVGVAVLVGLLGLMGTVVTGIINAVIENQKKENTLILEKSKQETNLISKISDIQDEKQRALNLLFYAQIGLLTFHGDRITELRNRAGLKKDEPVPPPVTPSPTAPTDAKIRSHIQTHSGDVTSITRKVRKTLESGGYRVDYGRVAPLASVQRNTIYTNEESVKLVDNIRKILEPFALNFDSRIDNKLEKDEFHILLSKE